jgi:hypothetical protein
MCAARPAAAELPDAEVSRRLSFIEARLEAGQGRAGLWWNAWYGTFLGLTAVQGGAALALHDPGLRQSAAVGAVTSSLGVIPLTFSGFPARDAGDRLRALPESTPAERRLKLARAEHLLKTSADAEILGRSWLAHAGGAAVALVTGLVLGLGYKRGLNTITSVVASVAVVETEIWTQPTAAIDDYRAYRARTWGGTVGGTF